MSLYLHGANKGLQPLVQGDLPRVYHITWVTHNSRVSERMVTFGVKRGDPILLGEEQEREVASYIAGIVHSDGLCLLAFSICRDHVHMILVCKAESRDNIVRKLKGKSTQLYKQARGIIEPYSLWAQKYHYQEIVSDIQLSKTLHYVTYNRQKHDLPFNKGLQPLVDPILTPLDEAFISQVQKVVKVAVERPKFTETP